MSEILASGMRRVKATFTTWDFALRFLMVVFMALGAVLPLMGAPVSASVFAFTMALAVTLARPIALGYTAPWTASLEAALARRGIRVRTATGQLDPIWMLVIAGGALVLAFLVWKVVIPAFEGTVSNTGNGINTVNNGIQNCENNPSANCTVTNSGGGSGG
ncbi:MAG: hypothetical protein QXI12_10965 [Candidatus Methanomethyliaceae archaeon]